MNKRDETETPLELVDEVNHIRRIWIVQSALFFVLLCVMLKGVPGVERIFKDFDAELPKSTQFMINVENLFTRYWFLAVGGWLLLMGALHLLCRSGESVDGDHNQSHDDRVGNSLDRMCSRRLHRSCPDRVC